LISAKLKKTTSAFLIMPPLLVFWIKAFERVLKIRV
jgi:hypothetical protein